MGYSPWGHKESGMTERLTLSAPPVKRMQVLSFATGLLSKIRAFKESSFKKKKKVGTTELQSRNFPPPTEPKLHFFAANCSTCHLQKLLRSRSKLIYLKLSFSQAVKDGTSWRVSLTYTRDPTRSPI